MRPEADPRGVTCEGGSAPGPWEALRVQPSRGFDTMHTQRGLGDRALAGSAAGLQHGNRGASLRIRHSTGPLERITVAEEVEDGWERRGGAAGGRRVEAGGAAVLGVGEAVLGVGEGDVTDAGAAAAPVSSEGRVQKRSNTM